MLVSKLHCGTSKTKQLVPVHLDLPLFWKSPACVILYHVTGSCKGPIDQLQLAVTWQGVDSLTLLINSAWIKVRHKFLILKRKYT